MAKISAVVLVKNEENNILDCLESIKSLDEIIIIDDNSDDRTLELIQNSKFKIYKRYLDGDFSAQRNFGLSKATCEWVLFIDADERISKNLLVEINDKVIENKLDGFFIKRRDIMWGRKLNFGETGGIKLLRLARKESGKWRGKVHETWEVQGRVEVLKNDIIHYPHQTIREFLSEISLYSSIRAKELKEKNTGVSLWDVILYPKAKFFLNYFLRIGFMDGLPGFVFALMMSFHSFLVRSKLWLLMNK